ncbi:MAG: alpha/beta hydrolase [Acidimicrobiia bacterium]|nr:alpha/beta hydrolase [Acidimicrobiia bacterium]MYF26095.1 alpha/beta hydrolase [Acidimicrobiia bacterium]
MANWQVPEPDEILEVVLEDGTVTLLRRYGDPSGHRMVLSHGNGLAIDAYFPFWSLFLNDFDVVVYDLRNHGWNDIGSIEHHTLPDFIRDHDLIMGAVDEAFGPEPKVGVFHSISGLVSLLSPTKGGHFSGLVLLDPPLCKPGRSYQEFDASAQRLATAARSRTDRFKTTEQFVELMGFAPLYRRVVPGVMDLVARTTLRRAESGDGFRLRCPPEYEARIVDYASSYSVLVDFGELGCPIKVIGSDPLVPFSYLPTLDLSEVVNVDYDFLPDATHFLPLEDPVKCAEMVADFIDSLPASSKGSKS